MAQRLIHRAKLFWFPGEEKFELRCVDCNQTLHDNPLDPEAIIFIPGQCEPVPKLGIQTSDGISTEDTLR